MDGYIIIYATYLTTRKHFGIFASSGLHIKIEIDLPQLTLEVSFEITKNIAKGIEDTYKILECASCFTVRKAI